MKETFFLGLKINDKNYNQRNFLFLILCVERNQSKIKRFLYRVLIRRKKKLQSNKFW